jgi:hypothetical protein
MRVVRREGKAVMAVAALVALTLAAGVAMAQKRDNKEARVSPNASVSQSIGTTEVSVTYGRPAVKGRSVWTELAPYGKVWRTGANECATITFSKNVLVEGKPLAAGTYGLFTIPGKDEWTWIFSKNASQWGAFSYKQEEDALRVTAKPHMAGHAHEWLTLAFEHLAPGEATLALHWEKVAVPLKIQEAK